MWRMKREKIFFQKKRGLRRSRVISINVKKLSCPFGAIFQEFRYHVINTTSFAASYHKNFILFFVILYRWLWWRFFAFVIRAIVFWNNSYIRFSTEIIICIVVVVYPGLPVYVVNLSCLIKHKTNVQTSIKK